MDEIEVEAESKEEAIEIAEDVYCGDAHTHLQYGLGIVDYEVEELE